MNCNKKDLLLYAVTDRSWLNGRTLYDQVEEALKGGATFIQLREKNLDTDSFLKEAAEIIAKEINADGVHVGQEDMAAGNARAILGSDKIIGVSAHTVEEAVLAEKNGADYLGVGAAFQTGTKKDAGNISHETIKQICKAVNIPVIAIGGITHDNVMELAGSGICGIAVVSAIFAAEDITKATRELKELTLKMKDSTCISKDNASSRKGISC